MKQLIENMKNAVSEDTRETLEAIVYLTTIFAAFYAVIWVGNALGLC
jgi:hypothetical protein